MSEDTGRREARRKPASAASTLKESGRLAKNINSAPQFVKYFGPVLDALKALGGSGRPDEVRANIAQRLKVSEKEQSELLPSKVQPRFDNQVHWARFYLSKAGYVGSSKRGVWALTEKGRASSPLSDVDARELFKSLQSSLFKSKPGASAAGGPEEGTSPVAGAGPEQGYREQVLSRLQGLPASGFEQFCKRLLRESGFQEVTVTGKSGDGGIDGVGILEVNPLVSFKVLFQCKRYVGSVVVGQVRDFRGAMTGRADKGIVITTGSFTAEARKEAIRDGAPPIELVDGEKLITMLETLELGLKPRTTFEVDDDFFGTFS